MTDNVNLGREIIARLAEADREFSFAREVREGVWDHRTDVASAIANPTAFKARRSCGWEESGQ